MSIQPTDYTKQLMLNNNNKQLSFITLTMFVGHDTNSDFVLAIAAPNNIYT